MARLDWLDGAVAHVFSGVGACALVLLGCGSSTSSLECGAGTVEVNDECVAETGAGGSGGSDSVGGGAGAAGEGTGGVCPNAQVITDALIDDFEAGASRWSTSNDGTGMVAGTATGTGPPESNGGELASGEFGAHFHGSGFTDWGAVLSFGGWNDDCADLSAFSGVSFWARGGPGTGDTLASTLQVQVVLPSIIPLEFDGDCVESCYDHYKLNVMLTETWQEFVLPWPNFTQAGWGAPVPFTTDLIKALNFQSLASPEGTGFDWWIDDVRLAVD
jgi:hypothetical protein